MYSCISGSDDPTFDHSQTLADSSAPYNPDDKEALKSHKMAYSKKRKISTLAEC